MFRQFVSFISFENSYMQLATTWKSDGLFTEAYMYMCHSVSVGEVNHNPNSTPAYEIHLPCVPYVQQRISCWNYPEAETAVSTTGRGCHYGQKISNGYQNTSVKSIT